VKSVSQPPTIYLITDFPFSKNSCRQVYLNR